MTAATFAGCTVGAVILTGFGAYAWCILADHKQPVRTAVVRVRWAWLCRKPPARTEGKLNHADHLTFIGLVETWRQSDAPERTRT